MIILNRNSEIPMVKRIISCNALYSKQLVLAGPVKMEKFFQVSNQEQVMMRNNITSFLFMIVSANGSPFFAITTCTLEVLFEVCGR